MGKRDVFWANVPKDSDGNISWPTDVAERERLAREMIGATVTGALEATCQAQLNAVAGTMPIAGATFFERDSARARVFNTMTDEQREAARDAILEASFGGLYWILGKLEHFRQATVDVTARPFSVSGQDFAAVSLKGDSELHWLYFDWIKKFSDLRTE